MPIVKVPDCSLGFMPDTLPEELPLGAWSNVQNMRFRAGFAERFRGMTNVFGTPGAALYWIQPYSSLATRYWIGAGLAKFYAYDGVTQFDITPTPAPTGTVTDRYTGGVFNGVLIVNNSVDQPWQWGGATGSPAVTLTAWPSTWRAFSIRPFKNFLVAFGLRKGSSVFPHMVAWSNLAVPGSVPSSWTPAPDNEAGDVDLAETDDLIIDGLPMGDQMIVYKQRSTYSMRYEPGNSQIFSFPRIPGGAGLLARGCVVDTPIGHVCMTNGDIVVHQGGPAVSIADGVIRKWIFNQLNSLAADRSFLVVNPQQSEVLVCFPSSDSEVCNKAAVYNWIAKTWGQRDLVNCTYGATGQINPDATLLNWEAFGDNWESYPQTWDENEYAANESRVLFSRTTNVSAFDVGSTDYGVAIASLLERVGDSMGDADRVKLLRSVRPRVDASTGSQVNVTFGGSMSPILPPTWTSVIPFIVGTRQDKANGFASGRYNSIRFEGVGFDDWKLRSFDIDVAPMGTE